MSSPHVASLVGVGLIAGLCVSMMTVRQLRRAARQKAVRRADRQARWRAGVELQQAQWLAAGRDPRESDRLRLVPPPTMDDVAADSEASPGDGDFERTDRGRGSPE